MVVETSRAEERRGKCCIVWFSTFEALCSSYASYLPVSALSALVVAVGMPPLGQKVDSSAPSRKSTSSTRSACSASCDSPAQSSPLQPWSTSSGGKTTPRRARSCVWRLRIRCVLPPLVFLRQASTAAGVRAATGLGPGRADRLDHLVTDPLLHQVEARPRAARVESDGQQKGALLLPASLRSSADTLRAPSSASSSRPARPSSSTDSRC